MSEEQDSSNLVNVSDSSVGEKLFSRERISGILSSFKKRGTEILDSVKEKFEEEFDEKKKVVGDGKKSVDAGRSDFTLTRPKRCVCNVEKSKTIWRSKISEIGSMTLKALGKNRAPTVIAQPDVPTIQVVDEEVTTQIGNTSGNENGELHFLKNPETELDESPRISEDGRVFSVIDEIQTHLESQTPDREGSLKERKKSSIKPQRESLPIPTEPLERIEEIESDSIKIEQRAESFVETERATEEREVLIHEKSIEIIEEVPVMPVIDEVVEKEKQIQFEMVNISRQDFEKLVRNSDDRRIIRIDHKTFPPDLKDSLVLPDGVQNVHEEWKDLPAPIIDEIRQLTKTKRSHECPKACPCKFSQGLIDMYHEANTILEMANKISESRDHCKFQMTKSEINFFKEDMKMCNVMIGETRSRWAEMRELMDMWQEANEKLTVRKREIISILDDIESSTKYIEDVERLLQDWLPEGKMEKLRKAQRALEKEDHDRTEMLEDEERTFAKERIEKTLHKREIWQEEEKLYIEKHKDQRARDMLSLQSATNLMQKYIEERKSLLVP